MSDWADDGLDEADGPVPEKAFSDDIGSLAHELVDAAVKTAIRKQVAGFAAQAVDEAMTPELIEALQQRATAAASAAVADQITTVDDSVIVDEPHEPQLYYGSVDEFFFAYLRNVYRRKIDGKTRVWAARWWEHDEAVIRIEALWRAWEQLRLDAGTGMSVWWRDHADHHMPILMDPQGPFTAADATAPENHCAKGEPLPYEPPPAGLFPDVRQAN